MRGPVGPRPTGTDCSTYLYFIPGCFKLLSWLFGALCTDSCPRLRATMATARKRPRVPGLGLLAAERPSRSSGRLLRLCSEHTKDTCMLRAGSAPAGFQSLLPLGTLPSASDETLSQKVKKCRAFCQSKDF